MGAEDLTGKRFGRLVVTGRAPSFITPKGKKQIAWNVLCDCGTEKIVRGCDLRSGSTISCGCYNKEKDLGKKQYKDLTGKQFGRLTVDSYAYTKNKRAYWNCTCECGTQGVYMGRYLIDGNTKSCGCLKKDNSGIYNAIDLLGKRFGRLTVTKLSQRNPRKWHCICDCGNEVDIITNCLVSGWSKSCGCYKKDRTSEVSFKDISGQRFGKLTAIKPLYNKDHSYYWLCKCDCGKEITVLGHSLRDGNTKSCGCLKSWPEIEIANILDRFGISYQQQKTFVGCRDIGSLKFDFYLCDYNIALEFDGAQHYQTVPLWDSHGSLEDRQRRDAIKTKYCEENDIILLRIPYWEKDNIESILSDWLFLNTGE